MCRCRIGVGKKLFIYSWDFVSWQVLQGPCDNAFILLMIDVSGFTLKWSNFSGIENKQ